MGIVDIMLLDGNGNQAVLDICGRGSILGTSFMLKNEPWIYQAVNYSQCLVHVLQIKGDLVK